MTELSVEQEKQIIDFYLIPNSAREIERKFKLNLYQLKKLLKKYNIKEHNKQISYNLRQRRSKLIYKERYGVENPFQLENVKEKIKQHNLDLYGVEWHTQSLDFKNKSRQTLFNKYGAYSYSTTDKFKQQLSKNKAVAIAKMHNTNLKRYGVENVLQNKNILAKHLNTKRINGTFKTSTSENIFYEKLLNKFKKEDIIRQYKEDRYPFNCDFYIKSLDLFIELNLSWTHGFHKFNKNSIEDLNKIKKWQEKNTKYYATAINVWTIRDTIKFQTAKENNLNYLVFYTFKDAIEWLNYQMNT